MKKDKIIEIIVAVLFTISGGFVDAYSFISRGGLFVSMQTGNLIKFLIEITKGNFNLTFFLPIVLFILGSCFSLLLSRNSHHETIVILSLLFSTIISGICPNNAIYNLICISILSFVFAMQFQTFRKCISVNYTSTMCTNNMRLMSENIIKKDKTFFFYLLVIICFSVGCLLGVLIHNLLDDYSIIVLSINYLIILFLNISINKK